MLAEPARTSELFQCVLDDDEYVRMRAADALEKVCGREPALVAPLLSRILDEMAIIEQPSVQWHTAQILGQLPLDGPERLRAARVVRRYLETSHDWLVLGHSMDAIADLAVHDPGLRRATRPRLAALCADPRPAVAKRAARTLARLDPSAAERAPRATPPPAVRTSA